MYLGSSPRRPKRGNWIVVVVVGVIALVMLQVVGGLAFTTLRNIYNGFTSNGSAVSPIEVTKLGSWKGKDRITVLILGIDQRPDEDPKIARTDTLMLLTLDPVTQSAGMMSIPRDLWVPMPDGSQGRINTAHVIGGADFAKKTVEFNFGIPIQHYARVNFQAASTLIDLMNGIEVFVDSDINDPTYPNESYGFDPFYLPAGMQKLDGKTAIKYARTRHGSSDFARIRRQQQVVMALREKLTSTDAAASVLPRVPQLLQTLGKAIDTDMSPIDIVQLALYVKDNIPKERIAQVAIDENAVQPWTTPEGANVLIPTRDKVRELRETFYNPPFLRTGQAALPTALPSTGKVALQNGTPRVGLAGGAKIFLESKGFLIDSISDAPQVTAQTRVIDYRRRPDFVQQLVAQLGLPPESVVELYDPNSAVDVLVVLGDDYVAK